MKSLALTLVLVLLLTTAGVGDQPAVTEAPNPQSETVMVTYHPKEGKETELLKVLDKQWQRVTKLGLVIPDRLFYRGKDESQKAFFMEIVTWKDQSTPDNAPPEVKAIWKEMYPLVETRKERPGIDFVEIEPVRPRQVAFGVEREVVMAARKASKAVREDILSVTPYLVVERIEPFLGFLQQAFGTEDKFRAPGGISVNPRTEWHMCLGRGRGVWVPSGISRRCTS